MSNHGTTPHEQDPHPVTRLQPTSDPYGLPPRPPNPYASWFKRVGAYLIDALLVLVAYFPALIGTIILSSDSNHGLGTFLTVIGVILSLAVFVWNTCLRAGRTGYSIGKGVLGIKLVAERSGEPVGAGLAFWRYLLHIVDALPLYLGYLWPLWDEKRQTFSDKIVHTVVLNEPQ
jgi:uncharacterized RDD family membrane protein YckC